MDLNTEQTQDMWVSVGRAIRVCVAVAIVMLLAAAVIGAG